MNKTAIKNFAIWARNKLIADISYKAGLLGITEKGIKSPLPQSTQTVQFFDIGTKEPNSIAGIEIQQRKKLVEEIERKAKQSDYTTAYMNVIEEVAYTWFNRLIAIRFMEVNDYLPTRIRVLSSDSSGKAEPDLVTHAMEANLDYSAYEKDRIIQLKHANKLDELFRILFIKQCNSLNTNLPELFEKTSDYMELLLNVSFTDKEGVIYHLVNDIDEDDFNVSKEGQVEIIGWLYQYYNTEPKDETFALLKKNVKITKERIPAATQLFTPDWIVRYMVENSLGRLWVEGHPNEELKSNWKYYLDEAEQEVDVQKQLEKIREEYKSIKPEDIKIIDPAMGSGHILVYAFDVLLQIYESCGYSQRDAAKSIVENNLYGLDIDNRAYQLAYFAVMMKARQYNRRILHGDISCHIYAIQDSNLIYKSQLEYFGAGFNQAEKSSALLQLHSLLDSFTDAKEYGSLICIKHANFDVLRKFLLSRKDNNQMSIETITLAETQARLLSLVDIAEVLSMKYDVVITNPPYMGGSGMNSKVSDFVKRNYQDSKSDLFAAFIERGNEFIKVNGYNCMVTMQSWMFLSSFEKMRNRILSSKLIVNLMHMENMVMGIAFGTAVTNLRKSQIKNYKGTYNHITFKDIGDNDEPSEFPIKTNRFAQVSSEKFKKITGSPIAYWVSEKMFRVFETGEPINNISQPRQGIATADNNRFLRFWYEVRLDKCGFNLTSEQAKYSQLKWFPYNKGGDFRKWYGNNDYVVNWENDGDEIRKFKNAAIRNMSYHFRESVTWTLISSSATAFRYKPQGHLFDVAGMSMFPKQEILNYLIAFCNTSIAYSMLQIIAPTLNFQVGDIARLPLIIDETKKAEIDSLVQNNINISRTDWDSFETSWDFLIHPLICNEDKISKAFINWERKSDERFRSLKANEEQLNCIFNEIYGLSGEITSQVQEKDVTVSKARIDRDIRSFISYSIGCMFGRFSLDSKGLIYAGGQWDGREYKTFTPDKDNILPITDEEYFSDDIVGRFIEFIEAVYGSENIEENLNFIANALGGKDNSSREIIRNYFIKDFYKDHCKIYQKRPIYWLFESGKQNGFKTLIYMHRYDENTIGNLRIDYLHRMQRIYENEIARMQDTIENSGDAREVTTATKRKEKLIKQLQETKEYDEKIAHLALARTSIDLDDGVKVNYEKVQTDRDGKKLDVLAKI